MKKVIFILPALFSLTMVHAQKTKQPAGKTVQKTKTVSLLKNLQDSASYGIGISVINFYKQQGVSKVNSAMVAKAIDDILKNKKLLIDQNTANTAVMNYMNQQQAKKAKTTIEAGEAFLAANKKREGVITTASGLQYEILKEGNGPKPTINDTVICHYRGTFTDGNVFDESYSKGQPIEFALTGVIKGWTEVLQLMPVGSKYKVYVPYQLGYGERDFYSIPGGSVLIFEIELLGIKGK